MDKDGITDIGLFVPNNNGAGPSNTADWYWLISGNINGGHPPVAGTVNTLNHKFAPAPLGTDLFYQYGSSLAVPIVGLFDPPPLGSTSVATGTTAAAVADGTATIPVHGKHKKVKHPKHAKHPNHVHHPKHPKRVAHTKVHHRHRSNRRTGHLDAKLEGFAHSPSAEIPPRPGTEL
jgi:hypothetical protein